MSRFLNRTTQMVIDLVVLLSALWLALFLRFDARPPHDMVLRVLALSPYLVSIQYVSLVAFGVHRFQWRYVGLREATRIFAAIGCACTLFLLVRLASGLLPQNKVLDQLWLPIGIILSDLAMGFLAIAGVRAVRRLMAERKDERKRAPGRDEDSANTVLIGAGQAGLLIAKELTRRPDLGLTPIGFLDDDPRKLHTSLHGLTVLGTTEELAEVCRKTGATQALISIANAPGKQIRRIAEICRANSIPAKIIPGIYEIVGGQVNLSRIRELAIEDLLGREPVELEVSALREQLRDKVVFVTGAGGSIGSELCRQVCKFEPARVVLVERSENALFDIHRELLRTFENVHVEPCVADICDAERVRSLLQAHQPHVVLHAAAHKHVPMMEANPHEAIKNNVFGTQCLADASDEAGIPVFVMISTDKAVNPTSIMGASKRVAEIYIQTLAKTSKTRFVTVRFGNVLGSAGSVIPIFKEQIARGGPVTVTHAEMTRYFMTIPEASQLVLQAGTMGQGGEIFILDMGEPVKILDLARDMIELSGLSAGEDIEIKITDIRPGEKLFEELSVSSENADKTKHPKIFVGRSRPFKRQDIEAALEQLRNATGKEADNLRPLIAQIVPEYNYRSADDNHDDTDEHDDDAKPEKDHAKQTPAAGAMLARLGTSP